MAEGTGPAQAANISIKHAKTPAAAPIRPGLRFFLGRDIVAKHESIFTHGSKLTIVLAQRTEGVTRRGAADVDPGQVSAEEEATVLEGGRGSDRQAGTAPVHTSD